MKMKFFSSIYFIKKCNLDLCFNCDEMDDKLAGSKSFGKM